MSASVTDLRERRSKEETSNAAGVVGANCHELGDWLVSPPVRMVLLTQNVGTNVSVLLVLSPGRGRALLRRFSDRSAGAAPCPPDRSGSIPINFTPQKHDYNCLFCQFILQHN